MDIQHTSLWPEVQKIIANDVNVLFFWSAIIHVNGTDYKPQILIENDFIRDFANNNADAISLKLKLPFGLWAKVIYPNRTNLEITLIKTPMQNTAGGLDRTRPVPMQRMAASLVLEGLTPPTGGDIDRITQDILDLRDAADVNFQLFSKTIQSIRMVTVGGIFRNCTNTDVIKGLLAGESNKINIDTGKLITNVDMVTANNTTKRDHVIIPHGTRLMDVPGFLQDKVGGVYNGGINSYIQNKTWYVYPLFDTTRINTCNKILTIIKVPRTLLNGLEVTYRQDGNSLFILATSDAVFQDDGGTNFLNRGNGVRFADAVPFMTNIIQAIDNKAIAKRASIMNEFVSVSLPNNNVQTSDRKINANPYREYSKLAASRGGYYQFVWDNSDISLLYPGMMVKILYLSGNNVKELDGTLIQAHSNTGLAGKTITATRHNTNSGITVFVNPSTVT